MPLKEVLSSPMPLSERHPTVSLLELFCLVDDFWQTYVRRKTASVLVPVCNQRQRQGVMCESEIMTLLIHFHQTRHRDFKTYYTKYVHPHLRAEFPMLLSYGRFIQRLPRVIEPLCAFLGSTYGLLTGISFIDSTALAVCDNRRISQHKVFTDLATRGKTSTGWFFGVKVHLVINDEGSLLAVKVTQGHVDDRKPVPGLVKELWGKLFGDKGYLSQALTTQLHQQGLHLITKLKKNMTNHLMLWYDKVLLRKRAVIESVIDQLKNISQIEHTRHRSPANFMVHLVCGLIAYNLQPKKPSLGRHKAIPLPAFIHN